MKPSLLSNIVAVQVITANITKLLMIIWKFKDD